MLQLSTKVLEPLKVEIDGEIFEVKKITNRVILQAMEISEKMQQEGLGMAEAYNLLTDFIVLYLPVDRDWVLDHLSPQDCRRLMTSLQAEMSKSMEGIEPPLASGPGGDNLPK